MTIERLEVQRTIEASPPAIFAVLRSPRGHVSIDSSGMLLSAEGTDVTAVGDTFIVHMDREALNDYPMGKYDVTITITAFERITRSPGTCRESFEEPWVTSTAIPSIPLRTAPPSLRTTTGPKSARSGRMPISFPSYPKALFERRWAFSREPWRQARPRTDRARSSVRRRRAVRSRHVRQFERLVERFDDAVHVFQDLLLLR